MADKNGDLGQMAVVQPKATDAAHATMGKERAAELFMYLALRAELGLGSGTIKTLEKFEFAAKKSNNGIIVENALIEMLGKVEVEGARAIKERGGSIGSERLESAANESMEKIVKLGFTKEEASYLVGKALIDMGLKEPLQKMLSFSGTNVDLINAFMIKMRALSYAREQKEKSERDLKNVLAEHNVTEHKYEAA